MEIFLYADDLTVVFFGKELKEIQTLMNNALIKLQQWTVNNKLILNLKKTKYMQFRIPGSSVEEIEVSMKNEPISRVKKEKFLGLIIDECLTWKDHIQETRKKLNRAYYMILKLSKMLKKSDLISAYHGLFESQLYGIELWGNSTDAKTLLKVQKKVIRAIVNKKTRVKCKPLFQQLSILTIPSLYVHKILRHVKTNISGFKTQGDMHIYSTRQKNMLRTEKHASVFYEKSVEYIGIVLYNLLPKKLKIIDGINKFNKECRKLLIKMPLYDIRNAIDYSFESPSLSL